MNRTDKTAAELIADMNRLQAQYDAQRCPHCNRPTLRTVGQSVDCTNRDCRAYMLTMEPGRFMALTTDDFAAFEAGRNREVLAQIDVEQELFELKMARLQRDLEARQAARVAGERVFG